MSKDYLMNQCFLQNGKRKTTTWLPTKFAIKGKFLKLKDENGWEVLEVSQSSRLSSYVIANSQNYAHQREVSDV